MKDIKARDNMKKGWLKKGLKRAAEEAKEYPKEVRERYQKDFPLPGVERLDKKRDKFSS